MQLTDYEKGYIAGIIDGEGSICLTKHHANEFRSPDISVTSTTYEILDYLKNKIGGIISSQKTKKETYKQSWVWHLKTNSALELLEQIQDYLLVPQKKARAQLLTSTYKQVTSRNGRYSKEKLKQKLAFEELFFKLQFAPVV